MKLTRTSMFTGKTHTMELDVTDEQIGRYNTGALVQEAFPNLSAGEREFIINGVTPEEWNQHIGSPPRDNLLCIKCSEEFDAVDNETNQQWQCPCCGSWNDKKEVTP